MNRGFAVDRRRQVLLADDDARDGESVGRVALAEATQATALASREPGGHFDDLLAGGVQSVRHGCAQSSGALDIDPPWRGQTGQEALEAAEGLSPGAGPSSRREVQLEDELAVDDLAGGHEAEFLVDPQ